MMFKTLGAVCVVSLLGVSSALASTVVPTTTTTVDSVVNATPAPAAEPAFNWKAPGTFGRVYLGAYGPSDDDKTYDLYDPQTGVNGGLAVGYRFSQNLTGQLEVGYQQSSGNYEGWEFIGIPTMAVVHLGLPVEDKIEIYVLGGIGALFYSVEDINQTQDNVAMATKVGMGVSVHFGKYSIGGEVGYQMTNVDDAPNDAIISSLTIGFGH
jgi:opacity protein-like surface antigen